MSECNKDFFTVLLWFVSEPAAKYGILSKNRRSKLHAGIDSIFFSILILLRDKTSIIDDTAQRR